MSGLKRNALTAIVVAAILGLSWIGASAIKGPSPEQAQNTAIETRQLVIQIKAEREAQEAANKAALVLFCETKLKPAIETQVGELEEAIAQSKSPVIRQLFFGRISPGRLGRLIARANAAKRTRIRQLTPVGCKSLAH